MHEYTVYAIQKKSFDVATSNLDVDGRNLNYRFVYGLAQTFRGLHVQPVAEWLVKKDANGQEREPVPAFAALIFFLDKERVSQM